MITDNPLVDAILGLTDELNHVSFAEVNRRLDELGLAHTGESALTSSELDALNIVVWVNMSTEYVRAVSEVLRSGTVVLRPASFLSYLVDGEFPTLPIVTKEPLRRYKEPHWLPAVLVRA